ncbi:MAG: hypothetical protein LBC84_00820 [Prevotellaceae bacterium]|jgi:hypothetical protein|nr:hypothetical protein [Prevotellaceae bacterium]
MQIISIQLNKIPKDRIRKGTDGNLYISLVVSERKAPDQYGNNLTVSLSKTEQERKDKAATLYVGSGKTHIPKQENAPFDPIAAFEQMPKVEAMDDLPF